MEVLYEVRGRNLLIYLPEELDHHNAKIITEQSDWYIISNKIQNIIFNFKRTKFMDSSGIGVIMGRYKLVKNRGGKVTVTNINNSIDRILTISGLYKIVEKTITPEDGFSIAFAVLLDLSGSMSSGGRIESAQKAGLVMYTFCRNLGIPVMLYGHTTHDTGYTEVVDIYSFADFDSVDNQDYLRIMSVSTYDCNRDGVALRFVGQKLLNRPEDIKILLMISDGQPYAQGYKGEIAKADLQEAKYSLEKRGVKLFSAAIGDDREMIEEIYKDGFLNIADFNTMPVKLAGLIARFIR